MSELKLYNVNRDFKWKDVIPSKVGRIMAFSVLMLGWANFLVFMGIIMYFGGSPQEGLMAQDQSSGHSYLVLDERGEIKEVDYNEYKRMQREEEKYYVAQGVHVTQVSGSVYCYLRLHGDITLPLFALSFIVGAVLAVTEHRYKKRKKIGIFSDEAKHLRRKLKLVAWIMTILCAGFLLTFYLLLFLT